MKNRKILITGGGFIGRSLIHRAVQLGAKVKALEIDPQKAEKLKQEFKIEVVVGSVLDQNHRAQAIKDVDTIIHTAAIMRESGSMEEFRKTNVEASYHLADEARHSKVKVFVHLSSVMVYGFNYIPYITEEGPLRGEENPYCQTKIEGEAALLPLNDPKKMAVIIIRPGDVYGPGCDPWVVRPLEVMDRGLFALPSGGKGIMNATYVDNLADAIFLAIEKKAFGEIFNITDGHPITWSEYFHDLAEISGRPIPKSLPYLLSKGLVFTLGSLYKLFGNNPPLTMEGIDFINRPHPVSIEKARKILGFSAKISYKHGKQNIKTWLEKEGRILKS
jgi:nucleoside-diphosphate-sugar epimerase